jgi:predicted lipoprotein
MIDKGVALAVPTPSGLDTIGAPGRGLPALEWLLWAGPAQADTPSCRYAALLAQDVAQEAAALNTGFQDLARQDRLEDAAWAGPAMSEVFNQWTGAIEALRWKEMGKPLASAPKGQRPAFARPFSQLSTQGWTAQWSSIQALSVLSGERAPAPGAALVPIEAYLRGRGLNTLAQSLVDTTSRTDRAMRALTQQPSSQTYQAAMNALDALKRQVESQVAPALQISIGFSDADGD